MEQITINNQKVLGERHCRMVVEGLDFTGWGKAPEDLLF
jgi:hypothetical protein